ncbi:EAL and HDOD domain-containing protein [Ornithinibacillus halotolerans]|uniref:EAL and modified HD-GYP domain-containing signal transduction protein n=1 Tax=Ornithinibacillus halotolerans TaxID=1274357 RepID=A0A916S2B7_9BACI|nr:HDOD domain-containing protein [Ornithinibacillus halotolerans]GGA81103.1 hypothetical protein GCM10008025_25560 [Ornithinibacillus halotolerans]
MELFVARQPILTTKQDVFAYELLYRNNNYDNRYSMINNERATSEVINSLLQIGIDEISENKPCFINFSETLLEQDLPTILGPKNIVIEVLESVNPTDQVIQNCIRLKEMGYKIALDDFELRESSHNFNRLIELADIIKIDIQKTGRIEQLWMIEKLMSENVTFLAEKVETREEFEQCLIDGYSLFQGYFFSKPIILSTSDIPILSHNLFLIMSAISTEEPNINKIAEIIESDLALSYKLLRLLNSPSLGLIYEIKSIRQAIMLLGLIELRKWIFVLSYREQLRTLEAPLDEVIKLSLTRAKACELIFLHLGKSKNASSAFLVGLFSLMDTIFKQPLEYLLYKIPVDRIIRDTLLDTETALSPVCNLVIAAEKGDWSTMEQLLHQMNIKQEKFNVLYHQSVSWAIDVLKGTLTV